MGPRVSQASPSQALETDRAMLASQCGLIVSIFVFLANIITQDIEWSLASEEGARCVSDSCDGCCDVNKVHQSPCLQVDRWCCGDDGHYECQSSVMRNEDHRLDSVILL